MVRTLAQAARNAVKAGFDVIEIHTAHDLGLNRKFEDWTPEYGWWLEKRIRTMEGFATPTGVVKRHA